MIWHIVRTATLNDCGLPVAPVSTRQYSVGAPVWELFALTAGGVHDWAPGKTCCVNDHSLPRRQWLACALYCVQRTESHSDLHVPSIVYRELNHTVTCMSPLLCTDNWITQWLACPLYCVQRTESHSDLHVLSIVYRELNHTLDHSLPCRQWLACPLYCVHITESHSGPFPPMSAVTCMCPLLCTDNWITHWTIPSLPIAECSLNAIVLNIRSRW